MLDGGLIDFQITEVVDGIRLVFFSFVAIVGITLWIHATYFRDDEE